ncbi:ABC transporter ATP-binding protein [Gulosibacter sp. 10]|uniref:ABC transporter ATP-binding protein n=1 Tax=Gulosibacter sp. 10 TaxID=1255570 RepID=UPI00097E9CF4|nr:ABC transporter ATP-binding protein [Gulosibacter sp. 10]SJM60306.1 Branched-chain amino acid transport ATP-binding protein LivG (TC 3.A.1.4.1) [Gulosibacter sp. 10]
MNTENPSAPSAAAEPEALVVDAAGITFGAVKAVDDVSFEVRRGEVLGLIGPNGSGKTTTLNLISGLLRPSAGRIRLGDRDVTRDPIRRRVRLGIARTFQSVRPFDRLTVRQNIEAAAVGSGLSSREAAPLIDEIVEELWLGDHQGIPASSASAGLVRRIGIARALATRPRFILLDEPAAGQNESEGEELIESIKNLVLKRNCGVLLVEHDMSVVMNTCDRLHVLDSGRTVVEGDPAEVYRDPRVIEIYFGKQGDHA